MTPSPILPASATNWRRVTFFSFMKNESSVTGFGGEMIFRGSVRQLAEVVGAVRDGDNRIGGLIVLDEVVLDPALCALGENGREVDRALADVDHLVVWRTRRVLHVDHLEAAGITIEEIERLPAAEDHPVQIHLEIDERWIGAREKRIERAHAVDRPDLEIMIVVSESQSLGFCLRAQRVEQTGAPAPVVPSILGQ